MKTLFFLLAMLTVMCPSIATAEMATYDIYAQWNCISAPLVPINSDPLNVFTGINVVNQLSRFDAPTQTGVMYDDLDPTMFGNVLLGDGYWLLADGGHTVSYEGVSDGTPESNGTKTDIRIALPGDQLDSRDKGRWHLIGQPLNHDTPVSGIGTGDKLHLTDGVSTKTWYDAASAAWCASVMYGFDAVLQTSFTVGYDLADRDQLESGCGYLLETYRDDLALIVPAD